MALYQAPHYNFAATGLRASAERECRLAMMPPDELERFLENERKERTESMRLYEIRKRRREWVRRERRRRELAKCSLAELAAKIIELEEEVERLDEYL